MTSGSPRVVGRYLLCDAIAAGGMATVHLGRLIGPQGFSRTVAIKQLHPQFARDPEFAAMFLDEARLASRVCHPNVVSPIDVVSAPPELLIVMDYVHGEPLSRLSRRAAPEPAPERIAAALISQVLLGLHAVHEATGENGEPLELIHRDVSPHNILVMPDGMAKVVDFGIAKGRSRTQQTERGKLKGKLGYMAPEQVNLEAVDQRADVFAVGVVLWELLTGRRLFSADTPAGVLQQLLSAELQPPSSVLSTSPTALDGVVMQALARNPDQRFASARAMVRALDQAVSPCSRLDLAAWAEQLCGPELASRAARVAQVEGLSFEDFTQALPHPLLSRAATEPATADENSSLKDSVGPAAVAIVQAHGSHRLRRGWAIPVAALLAAALFMLWSRAQHHPAGGAAASGQSVEFTGATPSATPRLELPQPGISVATTPNESKPEPAASANPAHSLKPAAAARGKATPCDVPYTIDKNGVKRFKEACF